MMFQPTELSGQGARKHFGAYSSTFLCDTKFHDQIAQAVLPQSTLPKSFIIMK